MFIVTKVFFLNRLNTLVLILLNVTLISLIFFISLFLQSSLQDFLITSHLGAIPSVSVTFENPVSSEMAQSLEVFAHDQLKADTARRGYRHESIVRVDWVKGDLVKSTKFEMVFIGWQLPAPLWLKINFENRAYQLPCLKIHPAKGFYIPANALSSIGSPIEVISARFATVFADSYALNLNVVLRKETESINGIACRRFAIQTPQNGSDPQEEIAFRKKEQRFYEVIGDFLSTNLGQNLARSMNNDLRLAQYRLYNGEAMCIPSIQIWEDICGIGLSDRASFKQFEFTIGNNLRPHSLKTYGFLNTRYGSSQNGYVIYLDINQMPALFDWQRLPGINFFEMEIPNFSQKDGRLVRLSEFVSNRTNNGFTITPWWERCDQQTVKFITRTVHFVQFVGAVILFFGFFGMYHLCLRFSNEVRFDWQPTSMLFGGNISQFLKIFIFYTLFVVLTGLCLFWAFLIGILSLPDELLYTYSRLVLPLGRMVSLGIGVASIGMLIFSFSIGFAKWHFQILTTLAILLLAVISTFIEIGQAKNLSGLIWPLSVFFLLETGLHILKISSDNSGSIYQ